MNLNTVILSMSVTLAVLIITGYFVMTYINKKLSEPIEINIT